MAIRPEVGAAGEQVGRAQDRLEPGRFQAVPLEAGQVAPHHLALDLGRAVLDRQLEHEAVKLRLRQRVRPLVLDRVLGRDHQERVGQRVALAVDGDAALLHRFQQGGLGLGGRAVDLVGQQDVAEDRARPEVERDGARIEDGRADDVGRHQVRGELDPPERAGRPAPPGSGPAASWPCPARPPAGRGRRPAARRTAARTWPPARRSPGGLLAGGSVRRARAARAARRHAGRLAGRSTLTLLTGLPSPASLSQRGRGPARRSSARARAHVTRASASSSRSERAARSAARTRSAARRIAAERRGPRGDLGRPTRRPGSPTAWASSCRKLARQVLGDEGALAAGPVEAPATSPARRASARDPRTPGPRRPKRRPRSSRKSNTRQPASEEQRPPHGLLQQQRVDRAALEPSRSRGGARRRRPAAAGVPPARSARAPAGRSPRRAGSRLLSRSGSVSTISSPRTDRPVQPRSSAAATRRRCRLRHQERHGSGRLREPISTCVWERRRRSADRGGPRRLGRPW